jgi:hypothetical protein
MRCLFGVLCVCALGVMPLVGCSETQLECESAEDCNDGNECTDDACDPASGTCSNTPVDDGTDCDLDPLAGVCVSGVCGENLCEGVVCEDGGNECTGDVCNFADGTCNVSDGTSCSTGACLDGVCAALVSVSGIVNVIDVEPSLEVSATVEVLGTSLSTTTDERGDYSFSALPGDWFFRVSKEGTWGEIELHTVEPTGPSYLYFSIFSDALIAELAEMLTIDVDDTKGWVWLRFDLPSGDGGETATLSAPYVGAWTWDADDDNLVLPDELLPGVAEDLTFFSVGLTDELVVTPMGVDGVNTCELRYPGMVNPVVAKFLTSVAVSCNAVP